MTVTAPPSGAPVPALQPRLRSGLARVALGVLATLLAALLAALLLAVVTGQVAVARVTTGSMAPAVPVGSLVVGRPVDAGRLRVGDLLTAHVDDVGGTVTHRVVSLVRDGARTRVQTRGDANDVPDPWTTVLPSDGATRVVATVPHLGLVLGRGAGGVPLLALPVLVLLLTAALCRRLLALLAETS